MLAFLPASRPRHQTRPAHAALSVATFALLDTLMFVGGGTPAFVALGPVADTTMVFLTPFRPPAAKDSPRRDAAGPGIPQVKGSSAAVVADPTPRGFQVVVAPLAIGVTIPPVNLSERPIDARDFTGRDAEGGESEGVTGGNRTVAGSPVVATGAQSDSGALYEASEADPRFVAVRVVSMPVPTYPEGLKKAGIGGRVVLRFVVDTLGLVEAGSIKVLESTHEVFETPARMALLQGLFRPARLAGRPVRQLCSQPVRFVAGNPRGRPYGIP